MVHGEGDGGCEGVADTVSFREMEGYDHDFSQTAGHGVLGMIASGDIGAFLDPHPGDHADRANGRERVCDERDVARGRKSEELRIICQEEFFPDLIREPARTGGI